MTANTWRLGRPSSCAFLLLLVTLMRVQVATRAEKQMPIYFVCDKRIHGFVYDIVALFRENKTAECNFVSPLEAYGRVPEGAVVLLLSDGQSDPRPFPSKEEQIMVRLKKLKVYIEFCALDPARQEVRTTTFERVVVPEQSTLEGFVDMQLLHPHVTNFTDLRYPPVKFDNIDLVLAKVAGFDTAVYGLPDPSMTYPVIVKTADTPTSSPLLLTSMPLSSFVTSRFSPLSQWRKVWHNILEQLGLPQNISSAVLGTAIAPVRPSFTENETLPANAEALALKRGLTFYLGMLPDSKITLRLAKLRAEGGGSIDAPVLLPNLYERSMNHSQGRMGILEGFNSKIDFSGNQYVSTNLRNDCISETAMALAMGGSTSTVNPLLREKFKTFSKNLLDYPWIHGGFSQRWLPGVSPDPLGDSMGLLSWSSTTDASTRYYVDDNARSILAGFATRALLGEQRWDSIIARAILGNFRMAGVEGFSAQNDYIFSDISKQSWEHFHNQNSSANTRLFSPHYQSYVWAVFIRADGFLGDTGVNVSHDFYERANNAISMMMMHYPTRWQNTANGITMQRARMLLPLSWMVQRANDKKDARAVKTYCGWLNQVATGLLARQHANGAIYEEISAPGWGGAAKVPNNENYGTFEAPLNQKNTDPVSDLLYTSNFALLGLHEAWHATSNATYKESSDRLAEFLVRIQARATRPKERESVWLNQWDHPEFDGAYFRAFATNYWSFWASDADLGWGAWAVETGWSQSWITTVFGLREKDISLWTLCGGGAASLAKELQEWAPYFGVKV